MSFKDISLDDILENDILRSEYEEYLEKIYCIGSLRFIDAVNDFKNHESFLKAKIIIHKFIKRDSKFEINVCFVSSSAGCFM